MIYVPCPLAESGCAKTLRLSKEPPPGELRNYMRRHLVAHHPSLSVRELSLLLDRTPGAAYSAPPL